MNNGNMEESSLRDCLQDEEETENGLISHPETQDIGLSEIKNGECEEKAQTPLCTENAEQEESVPGQQEEFIHTHPNVDLESLNKDKLFIAFSKGKETMTFTEIYDSFVAFSEEIGKREREKEAVRVANSKATAGSLSTCESYDDGFYTKEEVEKMTPAEIRKNYTKIRKSQEKW